MSAEILAINRAVLPQELLADAAADAVKLRNNFARIGDFALLRDGDQMIDGHLASPFMVIDITSKTAGVFKKEAPNLSKILQRIAEVPTSIEGISGITETGFLSLTINYLDTGTMVNKHRDSGITKHAKVSRVATLRGKGLFGIITPPGADPIDPIVVEAGDLHELFNPANPAERPLHWATSTDELVDRISIGYQVPAVI
ncbi:MAG: hypothetical protein QG628_224 [Patescibacteria group bacterium]|jgi:hypothetical protein|nr:hypothetical protein [Patescibacteria group bacterium]